MSAPIMLVPAVDRWRETLAAVRLPDTLLGDGDLAAEALDLTHAHPSGLATLMAGRSTRLSSLVREPATHATARHRARAIKARADELAAERGVRSCYLAAGLVTWWPARPAVDLQRATTLGAALVGGALVGERAPEAMRPISAPLLMRGCSLHPRGAGHDDYELDLDDVAFVNPELLRRLRAEHGIALESAALSGLAFGVEGFDPRPVYALLEDLCSGVPGFTIERRLIVGSFTGGSGALLADLDAAHLALQIHPLLGRLANETPVAQPSTESSSQTPGATPVSSRPQLAVRPYVALDPEPETDDVPFDLDPAQRAAVDAALGGLHVAVEGAPGTGLTHTLAAITVTLVGRGGRALVVTPHRSTADAFVRRLAEAGLGDLVLDLHDGVGDRGRLLAGLGSALAAADRWDPATVDEPVARASTAAAAVAAAQVRSSAEALAGASQALHAVRTPWGVSAYDAMVALAALMAAENAPRTRVRLSGEVCRRLDAATRDSLRADLREVAAHGAFRITRMDTRWLGARVRTAQDATAALTAARVARDTLPAAERAMAAVIEAGGLVPARSVSDWRPRLTLLLGIRDTLDVLLPTVYEQPIADLLRALDPEGDRSQDDTGWLARRGLRRRARALVRPGTHLPDLRSHLVTALEQRAGWQQWAQEGGWPRVPNGLAEAEAAVSELELSLAVVAAALDGTDSPDLLTAPFGTLLQRLTDLAADDAGVLAQPRRTVLIERLRAAGLGDLLADLRERRAGPQDVDGELDLAWWTSVLETIIRGDQRLARHDPQGLRACADTMREGQQALIGAQVGYLLTTVALRGAQAVRLHPDQTRWLRSEVHHGHRSDWPADLFAKAPDVIAALRPIWVMSPDAVARSLPPAAADASPRDSLIDLVAVDDAGQVGLPECAAALARGRQIIVAGDRRRLPPATGGPSVIEGIASLAGRHPLVALHRLDRDHRTRDGRLLYPLLDSYPQAWGLTPGAAPCSPLTLEHVRDGTGLPAAGEQVVSADAEVARVVRLVGDHAARRPGESLLVVTLGARHAIRIEEALRAEVAERPELARWLDVHWAGDISEPFMVRPIHRIAGLERDAVIVSIGQARTPHGRVLHRFGVLDGPFGRACLVTALSRARRRTTIVCCFTAEELAPERLRSEGARMLRDVLELAADPVARGDHLDDDSAPHSPAGGGVSPDALVTDLRDRLDAVGLRVTAGPDSHDWPLALAVGDPDQPGRRLLAVEVDGREHAACLSVTERDRHRREAVERAGWTYVRVAAMDLFCDPVTEVERIRSAWRVAGGGRPATPATGLIVGRPRVREGFPKVTPGRPITAYGDADLESVAAWVMSDGVQRTAEDLAALVREALYLPRRGTQVEAAVGGAARRVLDGATTWRA